MGYQRDVAEECLADAKQDINLAVSMLLDGYEKKTEEGDNVIDLSVDG
jgi:UDP-N-acetyl-D-mannosaminuronic acid transferase (WecB/TagA/CpsF family)